MGSGVIRMSELRVAYRGPYIAASSAETLERLNAHHGVIAIDTETVSLKDRTCIGIGIYLNSDEGMYVQVLPETSPILPQVMALCADTRITKIYHNGMYDLGVLTDLARHTGLPEPDYFNIEDTSIMAQVQGQWSNTLQELGTFDLGFTDMFSISDLLKKASEVTGKKKPSMLDVPWQDTALKCLNDCRATFNLYSYLNSKWHSEGEKDCYDVDRKLIPILHMMEDRGLALINDKIEQYWEIFAREKLFYEDICQQWGFNPGSPQQVGYVLASKGNILPFSKNKRQLVTSEEVLSDLPDGLAHMILAYRKVTKLLSTYVVPFRGADRAYTHFRIDLATGRLASGRVESHKHVCRNQQNIPPDMRDIFAPDDEVDGFTNSDFSQLEMRVFAEQCKDPTMIQAYKDNKDIHAITHSAVFPGHPWQYYINKDNESERTVAKTANFSLIFDAQSYTLSKHTKLPVSWWDDAKAKWFATYPGARDYINERKSDDRDYAVTDFGRRMRLPNVFEYPEDHINKCRVNYPTQGTAADIVKRAMLQLGETDLRLQVHDEYLLNGRYDLERDTFAKIHPEIYTPMDVKHGRVWK